MTNPNNLAAVLQEHIDTILQAYDKDKNSELDKEELRKLLADNLGVAATDISQDQLVWHFNRIDTDGDGKITFIEYFDHFFLKRAKETRDKIKKELAQKKEEAKKEAKEETQPEVKQQVEVEEQTKTKEEGPKEEAQKETQQKEKVEQKTEVKGETQEPSKEGETKEEAVVENTKETVPVEQTKEEVKAVETEEQVKETKEETKSEVETKTEGETKGESKKEANVENEDELIDINEFRKLIEDTFRPIKVTITEEMVQWNFNQIDKDNSGRISFEEFLSFIKKYNS